MEAVAYSAFRNNLRQYLDKTRDNAEPLLVTSTKSDSNVVVMNACDYDTLMENLYINSNPYLLDKITRGVQQAKAGKTQIHKLLDEETVQSSKSIHNHRFASAN